MSELQFREVVRQGYSDMHIASGFVDGHEVDTVYFEIVREDGSDPVQAIMRPDELAALVWVCAGTLWSDHMERLRREGAEPPTAKHWQAIQKQVETLSKKAQRAVERGSSSESADG